MDNHIYPGRNYQADNFVRFLLDGKREITDEEIEGRKKALGLPSLVGPFVVAIIAPMYVGVSAQDKDAQLSAYEQFVDAFLDTLPPAHFTLLNSYNNVAVLLALNGDSITAETLNTYFIDLHERLIEQFGFDVFIGIGSVADNYKGIAVSAADAQEMLGFKYQYADSGVVNIATLVHFRYNVSRSSTIEFERVIGCFLDGNLGKMEERLHELVESVRHRPNVSNTSIRRSLVEVTVHLLHAASSSGVDVDSVLGTTDPYRWIMQQNDTPVITEWIMSTSTKMLELIRSKQESDEKDVIRQARQYIEENLQREELNLQQISDAVGLSPTYCSQLFKKEVGMGIAAYITRNRILQAQTLLRSTELTAAEISKQVGFMSPGYFGQVFRKITGTTPQEYRRVAKN
ncbi:MAG: helix-turn-helix transcriptional regulator [Ruminococcaceae bacterium]|nr:helix-turn-helix transcriptional regulator [Oscillospiraceae bacterium]